MLTGVHGRRQAHIKLVWRLRSSFKKSNDGSS
jgi:hypothetical protein